MTDTVEAPEGLMLAVANAHDDTFRWKVAAAVVQVASGRLADDPDDAFAKRAIYNWTEVGEVFARYLAIGLDLPSTVPDDDILSLVSKSWDTLKE